MKNNLIKVLTITLIIATLFTGCKKEDDESYESMSKDELISEINNLLDERNSLLVENSKYKSTLNSIDSFKSSAPAISAMKDGSGNLTFTTYDSTMIFPSSFAYPETCEISGNSSISIVPNITIVPTDNWICKLNGATLQLEHTTGISGTVKVGQISKLYDKEKLQSDVMSPWFSGITSGSVMYSNIFMKGISWGTQAQTKIFIDEEPAYLKCGMIGFGNYSVIYTFVYRGEQDQTKDESVDLLINSLNILGQDVTVD